MQRDGEDLAGNAMILAFGAVDAAAMVGSGGSKAAVT
jgi:hypothetical protein